MVNVTDLMGTINHIAESIDKQNSSLLSSINLGMGPLGVGINLMYCGKNLKRYFENRYKIKKHYSCSIINKK